MNKAEKKLWIDRLKPFWELREKAYDKFRKREHEIEKAIKKAAGEDLEFFYVDGECVGIGHADWKRRKKGKAYFPLIQTGIYEKDTPSKGGVMDIHIPVWVLWSIGVLIIIIVLFLAWLGWQFGQIFRNWKGW